MDQNQNQKKIPTTFTGKELTSHPEDDWEDGESKYKPRDFESLQAYLEAFPFKWRIRAVHEEPCGPHARGGPPQMRIEGYFQGEGLIYGEFKLTFAGRRIDVILPPERQAIFERNILLLPEK